MMTTPCSSCMECLRWIELGRMRTLVTTLNEFLLVMPIIMTILFEKRSRTSSWLRNIECFETSQCMFTLVPSDINTTQYHSLLTSLTSVLHKGHCNLVVLQGYANQSSFPLTQIHLYDRVLGPHIDTKQDKALDINAIMRMLTVGHHDWWDKQV